MSFDEIDLKNKIEEQAKQLQVPDSLKPEAVEKKLRETGKKNKKRKKPYYMKIMAAAACCVLIIGAAGGLYRTFSVKNDAASGNVTAMQGESAKTDDAEGAIRTAENYDEIYQYVEADMKQRQSRNNNGSFLETLFSGGVKEMSVEDSADTGMDMSGPLQVSGSAERTYGEVGETKDYSDTNTRETDVAEADIVKTDGAYLYILHGQRVQIVDIGQDTMKETGEILLEDEINAAEIYLEDHRLIIVYTQYREEGEEGRLRSREYTVAETFDVSDPSNPQSIGKISQSGSYYTTRIKDGYVYLFSSYYTEYNIAKAYTNGYIPQVEGQYIECSDVYLPMVDTARKYMVVSSFSLENPNEVVDNKAIFGASGQCYVSSENIYVCESSYDAEAADVTQTYIRKIAYHDGELEAVGQTNVDGTLNDSFSIDEYQGNLRLVTTVRPISRDDGVIPLSWLRDRSDSDTEIVAEIKDSNSLYVLDANLKELARIEGLAEEEMVYSARFMRDVGYFVTYREMDPLFSVDLSDPANPKILGELKIPGFSDYLHPYGDGKLLGIGMDVDETGTTTNGVKLSMFDISDPANVTEAYKYVLEGTYSTEVSYNYKAAFVNVGKNLIGFKASGDGVHYYIFSYGEKGFECVFDRELTGFSSDVRALYAGDTLYLVAGNTVESYRLGSFEKVDDIVLGAANRPKE